MQRPQQQATLANPTRRRPPVPPSRPNLRQSILPFFIQPPTIHPSDTSFVAPSPRASNPPPGINTEDQSDSWGHICAARKPPDTLRVLFQNINGLPQSSLHHKNYSLRMFMDTYSVDIYGMAEVNVCWPLLAIQHRLPERTADWFESLHIASACNSQDTCAAPYQPGGVCQLSMGTAAHRVCGPSGRDPTGLGRWVWTRFRGRNNVYLRVCTGYRPCKSSGPITAYQQQQRYFYDTSRNEDRCPRVMFFVDLSVAISEWIDSGDQLIILLDVNDDVRSTEVSLFFEAFNMVELLTHTHGNSAPATYQRGSHPIDGIFVSSSLLPDLACGYFPFGSGTSSDHRCLWVDIPLARAFGHVLPPFASYNARRLKFQDPRVVQTFLNDRESFQIKHNMLQRSFDLQLSVMPGCPLSHVQALEYESLDSLRVQGMRYADHRCRKLCMGATSFSPCTTDSRPSSHFLVPLCPATKRGKN